MFDVLYNFPDIGRLDVTIMSRPMERDVTKYDARPYTYRCCSSGLQGLVAFTADSIRSAEIVVLDERVYSFRETGEM